MSSGLTILLGSAGVCIYGAVSFFLFYKSDESTQAVVIRRIQLERRLLIEIAKVIKVAWRAHRAMITSLREIESGDTDA